MPDEPEDSAILPASTPREATYDTLAAVVALAPGLGGPISNILAGLSSDRRFARVREVLVDLAQRMDQLSDEQADYVRSEEFEDLLIETLKRVTSERSEEKRRVYRAILTEAVETSGGDGYDEQLRFLRALEELQPDHLVILRAIVAEPEDPSTVFAGSRGATLRKRVPELLYDRIDELVRQLGDLRIVDAGMLGGMVTGPSAVDLRPMVTPFGHRLVAYVLDASEADA